MADIENTHNRNGTITAALTTGIIGTAGAALGAMANNGGLGGLFGGGTQYATKESVDNAIILAQKDSEIALLKSEANTENKITEVYERIMLKVNANHEEQNAINMQQAVYNSTANANVSVLQNQVQQLMGMTALYIPAAKVTPAPMPQYNSWTAPNAG